MAGAQILYVVRQDLVVPGNVHAVLAYTEAVFVGVEVWFAVLPHLVALQYKCPQNCQIESRFPSIPRALQPPFFSPAGEVQVPLSFSFEL